MHLGCWERLALIIAGTLLGIAISFGCGEEFLSYVRTRGGLTSETLAGDVAGSEVANLGGLNLAALDFHDGAPLVLVPPTGNVSKIQCTFWPTNLHPQWQSIDWPDGPPLPPAALDRSFTPPCHVSRVVPLGASCCGP